MARLLLPVLFAVVLVVPHVIPLPERPVRGAVPARALREVADDGGKLPDEAGLETLARENPIAFLETCLRRYDREVKGYRLTLHKQERLAGKLEKKEVIDVAFRDKPHAVLFRWRDGARLASRALYVAGENDGKVLIRPSGLGGFLVVSRDPEGADARKSGRYTLKEFGLKKGLQRCLAAFEAANKDGALHVQYLGRQTVKEAGDRPCHVLKRTKYRQPESDGVTEQTLFVDVETWLMVGTILKGEGGKLIGEYFFRDVRLNPTFDADAFTRKAVEAR